MPQRRERLFLIASRDGERFVVPSPTHGVGTNLGKYLTAWDAIGDLVAEGKTSDLEPGGKWAKLLPTIPEGHNYLWHTKRGGGKPLFGWRTRYWSFLLKLARGQPSWTISARPGPATGPFHWDNRLLSVRELCRLQTFPDDYLIYGDRRSAQRQIGNAVPCAIGELLGHEISRQLLRTPLQKTLSLLPKRRRLPRTEISLGRIPRRFRSRIGDHSAHPGEGLGPGALKRQPRT